MIKCKLRKEVKGHVAVVPVTDLTHTKTASTIPSLNSAILFHLDPVVLDDGILSASGAHHPERQMPSICGGCG